MSPTEAATQIATSAIDSLRSTPAFLMLLLINLMFVSGVLWSLHSIRRIEKEQIRFTLERCLPLPKQL